MSKEKCKNEKSIRTQKTLNVLGVLFDSKQQWIQHFSMAISKANRAQNAKNKFQ